MHKNLQVNELCVYCTMNEREMNDRYTHNSLKMSKLTNKTNRYDDKNEKRNRSEGR